VTAYRIAYRMTVYASRSVDPTEATILTPAAGAPHADQFKVATIAGMSGWQPYLSDDIQGRRGRIDLLSRKVDIGTLTVSLIDKKTGTDNLSRWVTAFFGNAAGKPMGRNKVLLEECLDYTAAIPTWTTYFVGEIVGSRLIEKIDWQFSLRERSETAKMKVFVGTPHSSITYAAIPTLMPLGFRGAGYGQQPAIDPLSGTTSVPTIGGTNYAPAGEIFVYLTTAAFNNPQNVVTQNLIEALAPNMVLGNGWTPQGFLPNYSGKLRCYLTSGGTSGVFRVGGAVIDQPIGYEKAKLLGFFIKALDSTDVAYKAAPAASTSVTFHLYTEEEVSEARPLLVDNVDPVTLLEDMCAGKFGPIYRSPQSLPSGKSYGDVQRSVATDATTFTALKNVWPTARFVVTKTENLIDWAEKYLLIPYCLAWYVSKSGVITLVDLRFPSSTAGIGTLTDDDVEAEDDPEWDHDPTQAIQRVDVTRYSEKIASRSALSSLPGVIPTITDGAGLVQETAHTMEPLYIGSIDYGDNSFKIDARGYRSQEGEAYQNRARSDYLDDTLQEVATQLQRPLAYGLTTIPLRCRRTATVTALNPGSLIIVDVDVIPDPATWKRGGPVLCRVLEYSEDGPAVNLRLVYLSSTSACVAPSLAAPAQETGNTYTGVTCAVTLNASSQPVIVRYAVTSTATGSAPANDSPLWRYANISNRRPYIFASQTVSIRGLPPGMRIWVQGQSFPIDDVLRMPSAWTAAAAPGYVDTATLTAPSLLAASVSDVTCTLSWTNGVPDCPIEVLLATPTSDPRRVIQIADHGSTGWVLSGLTPSTQYRAEVRHRLGQHVSGGDTEDFTTGAASTTAPALASLSVVGAT
jgi:hypothetical protein